MTKQERADQISEISQQLSAREQQLSATKTETRKIVEKRNRLNNDLEKLRQETLTLRQERDILNERAQMLKMLRDETRSKRKAMISEIEEIDEKICELEKKTPKRKYNDLKKEVDEIEWKIQTTSLDLKEEKQLIENVKRLETQLDAYKRIERQQRKIVDLREKMGLLDTQANSFHQELQAVAHKSQEIHARMLARIAESKRIRAEADSLHVAYAQAKAKAKPIGDEYKKLLEQRNRLLELLRTEEEDIRRRKQQELKEKIVSQALDKLKQGKELRWDEFQLLNGESSETQN